MTQLRYLLALKNSSLTTLYTTRRGAVMKSPYIRLMIIMVFLRGEIFGTSFSEIEVSISSRQLNVSN